MSTLGLSLYRKSVIAIVLRKLSVQNIIENENTNFGLIDSLSIGLIDSSHQPILWNLNHGETSRTECDHEEGRADEEEDRHQSQAEEGARPSSRIIIIIIVAIDPLQIRGSDLAHEG